MPRQLAELKQFGTGVQSSPSDTDIHPESAIYSENIDPISEAGKLKGVKQDIKILPKDGHMVFTFTPPWDGSKTDSEGLNYYPNGVAGQEEELILSIDDVKTTVKAVFDTNDRTTNENFFNSLVALINTNYSTKIDSVETGTGDNGVGTILTVDTFDTSVAFQADVVDGACTITDSVTGSGVAGTFSTTGTDLSAVTITDGGDNYDIDNSLTINETGFSGTGTCEVLTLAYPFVDHWDEDGNAWADAEATEVILPSALPSKRCIDLEFKDTVLTTDIYLVWNKYASSDITSTETYYAGEDKTGTENIGYSTTYDVVQDGTSYLELNATEMESFNDSAQNHIAFYSITENDTLSTTGVDTTHRMKVFEDVYGSQTIVDRFTEPLDPEDTDETAGSVDTFYDIPGQPADVSLEKNNAQIYIGTGNSEGSKSKWFGKIKHAQFGDTPGGYRLFDAEVKPIDKGNAIYNLDYIDYGYDGSYDGDSPEAHDDEDHYHEHSWDPRITFGITQDIRGLLAMDTDPATDSVTNANMGIQKKADNPLTFKPAHFYGSKWLWDQLNGLDAANWDPPSEPDADGVLVNVHTHNGLGHTYFWMLERSTTTINIVSVDCSAFLGSGGNNHTFQQQSLKEFQMDYVNADQAPPQGALPTDILETFGDQDGSGDVVANTTIVYVLFSQASDTPFTWDQEFLYYFNPATDIKWVNGTIQLHECTPPTPKLKKYDSWKWGGPHYADDNVFKSNFRNRTFNHRQGTWKVYENWIYYRYADGVGETDNNWISRGSNSTVDTGFKNLHSQWRLGSHLGWLDDGENPYEIAPKARGLIDMGDGHNTALMVAKIKGKWVKEAGKIKNMEWDNWRPRYKVTYSFGGEICDVPGVIVMYNINPNHRGVRHRQIPMNYQGPDWNATAPSGTTINQNSTNPADGDGYSLTATEGIWMAGYGVHNGYSEFDHHIYYFKQPDGATEFPGSNELASITNSLSDIKSMSKRIIRTNWTGDYGPSWTAAGNKVSGYNKWWCCLQAEDGGEASIASWYIRHVETNDSRGPWRNGIAALDTGAESSGDSYTPMIFKTMGTPVIAVTSPKRTQDFMQSAGTESGLDYVINMSGTQGPYYMARATWEKNAAGENVSFWRSPDDQDLSDDGSPSLSKYMPSELDSGLTFSAGNISEGENDINFADGNTYYYKMSLMYDGFQESPLNTFYFQYQPEGNNYSTTVVTVQLAKPPLRASSLCIYRKNSVEEFYRLIKDKSFEKGWGKSGDEFYTVFVDDGNLDATYEAITGMPESLRDTTVNYKLSVTGGGYLVVGNCFHPDIVNGQNFLFRSQPGNYSVFNWTRDFCILPNEPTALSFWAGRLYVFDKSNMYRIDLNSLAIEDIYEGVGCFGEQSFTVTDYGMFFCDATNMYKHDGSKVMPIGNNVLKNSKFDDLGVANKAWHNITHAIPPYVQYDAFNQNVMYQWQDEDGTYGSWNYNIPRNRWDLISIPRPSAAVQGNLGELWLSDGDYVYKLGEGAGRKRWDHYTPSLDFNFATVDKRIKRLKVVFNSEAELATADYTLNIYCDEQLITVGANNIKDTENVREYRIKGSEARRVKKMRLEILNSNVEIDSIGISYNVRTIK